MPPGLIETSSSITDVGADDCIPLTRVITVTASNGTGTAATLTLTCCGAATVVPSSIQINPNTPATPFQFTVTHTGPSNGHTVSVTLTQGTALLSSDEVGVNVGNPCPISIDVMEMIGHSLPEILVNKPLSGKFKSIIGNGVVLLVEKPVNAQGDNPPKPALVFADPAKVEIDGTTGKWTHPAIPNAQKGYYLRIVLTKDGVVKSIIRAVFK
jgi:hypothetical protein